MKLQSLTAAATFLMLFLLEVAPAQAQGLIWKLPPDGSWARYEGTYSQTQFRPDSPEGDLKLQWLREITIRSVGSEAADINGQSVPCRWIEIKSITGTSSEVGIDPGPAGATIIKALVPESGIVGSEADGNKIPVSFLPVVKGFRRAGTGEPQPIESHVLQVYPSLSLLMHYKTSQAETEQPAPLDLPGFGTVNARKFTAKHEMESDTTRSINDAQLWRSDDVPFGLAQWMVTVTRESKSPKEDRSKFVRTSEVREEMSLREVGTNAESELVVP